MMHRRFTAAILFVLLGAGHARADDSLYHDLGEQAGIVKIVDVAYDYILADPRIKDSFAENNITRLKRMISTQICQLVGGPCVYKGASMKVVHRGVHATEADFNALVEDLQKGMDDTGIPFSTQNRLLAILAPMERDIVTR